MLGRLAASATYRLERTRQNPREILWMLHRSLPGVLNSSYRCYVRRANWRGSPCIKKVYRYAREKDLRIGREQLAREQFADNDWIVPILDSGDDWLVMPYFPQRHRLDRAIGHMDDEAKAVAGDQILSILLDIHTAGYVHGDFHTKNLFWHESRVRVYDFDGFRPYLDGHRPPFADSYDVTGDRRGVEPNVLGLNNIPNRNISLLGSRLGARLGLDRDIITARLRDSLTRQLVDQVANSTRQRTPGSFSLPHLSFPARLAGRDSAQRLAELGVGEAEAKGASLLDLGSEIGGLLFEAQNFTPGRCVGLEGDAASVVLASRIAAFNGLNTVTFIDSTDRTAVAAGLAEPFDLVFCRLSSTSRDVAEPCGGLGRVTKRRLYIEGGEGCTAGELTRRLRDQGFSIARHIGDSVGRPLFVAEKA